MGIPHLISTLEPYAQHVVLQSVNVVVDGPGLAHHVLHVCRINGVDYPSYQLLGTTAVQWLDKLASQDAVITEIYFDGYLPKSKLPVRMQRAVKSTSQISSFYNRNSRGCPRYNLIEPSEVFSVDAFKNGRPETKLLEAPSFLVPAVIEALQRSRRYSRIVTVVPGEADGFCATAAAEIGGIVITSDSDLLVHDLGAGGVALLRDIYCDDNGAVRAALYRPREIFRALGLSGNANIRRFAYERLCSANTTTAMLVRACSEPVKDEEGYQEFCIQYSEEERALLPKFSSGNVLSLEGHDPRWSELLLQISDSKPNDAANTFRMFLPVLIDSPEKGTSWENSRYIRQLAYSLARTMLPGSSGAIHEYRRVQTQDQSGRQIAMLSQTSIHSEVAELASTLGQLSRLLDGKRDASYWLLAFLVLDIRGSVTDGRSPFAAEMLQEAQWPDEKIHTIPWRFVHFVAQIQAAYYSLRMLRQLICASVPDAERVAGPSFGSLARWLDELPSLCSSPDARSVSQMLRAAAPGHVWRIMAEFVQLPEPDTEDTEPTKRPRKQRTDATTAKTSKRTTSSNMFGLLPIE